LKINSGEASRGVRSVATQETETILQRYPNIAALAGPSARCIFELFVVADTAGDMCLGDVEYVDDERGTYANSSG